MKTTSSSTHSGSIKKNAIAFLGALLFISCIIISCRKNEEGNIVIDIKGPMSGQQFNPGDTFPVIAAITSNRPLVSATVQLLNSNYIPVATAVNLPLSNTHENLQLNYVADNLFLATGNYILIVTASDDHEETNAFVTVHATELPKERKAIYLLSASGSLGFDVATIDSTHAIHAAFNVNGDYGGSAIYSMQHRLFTIGKKFGNFNAYNLTSNALSFSHPPATPGVPYFQRIFLKNDLVYVSYYDGNIKGYDYSYTQRYGVRQPVSFIPDMIFKNDRYFFAELFYPSAHQTKIGVFDRNMGAEKQEAILDIKIVGMFTIDDTHLLLFGNDSTTGIGKIKIFNITGNGTNEIHTMPSGMMNNVIQYDDTHFLVSYSNGIYMYDYNLNGLTPYVTGLPVYSLTYDDVNDELFACSGNQIHVYNAATASEKYFVVNADSVLDVRLLFNK